MKKHKISEIEFKALVDSYKTMGEQIKMKQKLRLDLVTSQGITFQAFNSRRKTLGI